MQLASVLPALTPRSMSFRPKPTITITIQMLWHSPPLIRPVLANTITSRKQDDCMTEQLATSLFAFTRSIPYHFNWLPIFFGGPSMKSAHGMLTTTRSTILVHSKSWCVGRAGPRQARRKGKRQMSVLALAFNIAADSRGARYLLVIGQGSANT